MEENKINEQVKMENNGNAVNNSALPAKVSIWTKFKDFLFQDVDEMQLILTPREKKFVDFWCQDVTLDKVYNFMFKEIKLTK